MDAASFDALLSFAVGGLQRCNPSIAAVNFALLLRVCLTRIAATQALRLRGEGGGEYGYSLVGEQRRVLLPR